MRLSPLARWFVRGAAGLLVAALVVGPMTAGQPQPKAEGKSLSALLELWFEWAIGGDQPDHFKKVKFMPLPAGVPDDGAGTADDPVTFVGELDVTLKPGTSFVMPVTGWTQEVYLDGHFDPFLDDAVFTESNVYVAIDGKAVIDSTRQDLSRFYVTPTEFDSIIYYDEPTSYGSIGTVGFQALGFIHGPLSVGKHTMTLHSELIDPVLNIGFIYENTWHITVKK